MADDKKLTVGQLKKIYQKLSDELSRKSRGDDLSNEQVRALVQKKKQAAQAIGQRILEEQNKKQIVKNVTDKINTNEVVDVVPNVTQKIEKRRVSKLPSAYEYMESKAKKIAALKKASKGAGKKLLGSLPLVGGVAAALASGDASAAVPILGDVESLGPKAGSEEAKLEDMSLPMEERIRLLKSIRDKKE